MLPLSHLYELLVRRAVRYPAAPAVGGQQEDGWRTLNSRELLETVDVLAHELDALGVREGDRVVLWLPGHWRTPVYLFALWKLGAVPVPFDREMNPEAAGRIIASAEPRCLLVGYGERPAWAGHLVLTEWWEPGSRIALHQDEAPWRQPAEALAGIFYTSGTTGFPKGCMITHDNLCSQVLALHGTVPLGPSSRLASVLLLSHLFELTVGLLYPLDCGAAVHYVPSRQGPEILRVMQQQRITNMVAVPELLALMGRAMDQRIRGALPGPLYAIAARLSARLPFLLRRLLFWPVHRALGGHLELIACGGAALPADTQRLWERVGVRVLQGYGTSECSPVVACATFGERTPVGSVGKPLRGVEVRLSPEGELLVHGPNVMQGYWKDPLHTQEVLRDGWYATGDLAQIDESGNLWLLGRARDLIVLPSGMHVWPEDVEQVLRGHPAIKDAAVVPVPSPGGGVRLHAYLIPLGRMDLDLRELVAECNRRLAAHQRVATASWWSEADFPRSAILKVKRHLLPQPAGAVRVGAVLAADDPVARAVASVAKCGVISLDQTLAELGLDSLSLVELAVALEQKTERSIADEDLRLDMTVRDLKVSLLEGQERAVAEEEPETWTAEPPLWPYTWGRIFRVLASPVDLLYRLVVPRTVVLGAENLADLPQRTIFAGTHHGFADTALLRIALARTPARRLSRRLVVAAGAGGFPSAGLWAWYGILAFGLYPLRQYRQQAASLRRLARLAEMGNAILYFPQGKHTRPEQEQADDPAVRFRTGVAHLALSVNAAVVPFGVAGTERVMPASLEGYTGLQIAGVPLSAFTRGPLAIAFGAPMTVAVGQSPEAFVASLQDRSYALARQAETALTKEAPVT